MLKMLMEAGMNIARLNFSHGTHEYHFNTVQNLRRAVECYSDKIKRPYPLAIALDTKGPEIRTGVLDGENRDVAKEVELKKGEIFRLTTDKEIENVGSSRQVYVNYANIVKVVKKNDRIYIDDGLLLLIAEEVGTLLFRVVLENRLLMEMNVFFQAKNI
jgi:pyruvate kinase|uniref:pyruvate kinase n=1 Tax=Sipha flava TaxID=143950 RepID=A0A2S2QHB8_9HEMI